MAVNEANLKTAVLKEDLSMVRALQTAKNIKISDEEYSEIIDQAIRNIYSYIVYELIKGKDINVSSDHLDTSTVNDNL